MINSKLALELSKRILRSLDVTEKRVKLSTRVCMFSKEKTQNFQHIFKGVQDLKS